MCLAALQSQCQVQLLAKVLNDEIELIVSHDLLFLLPFCYPTPDQIRAIEIAESRQENARYIRAGFKIQHDKI
jgi:hypothetical protein